MSSARSFPADQEIVDVLKKMLQLEHVRARGCRNANPAHHVGEGGGSEGPLKKFMTSKSGTVWGCQMGGYDYLTLKCARSAQL